LCLKNFLLFKAFNKLVEGSALVHKEDKQSENAFFAYYLRIIKKSFLCLKLNAQLKFQDQKADEIGILFFKRRWLQYMKAGTEYLKNRRQLRHKASVFRFLSLQRRGI
jgi:hypothetical protein